MEEDKIELKEQKNTAVQVVDKTEVVVKNEQNTNAEDVVNTSAWSENITFNEKKKSKLGLILIVFVIILILIGIFSTIFAVINTTNNKILKGIKIDQIDVSKMTTEEAQKTLQEIYLKKAENEIHLVHGEFESTTTYEAIEVEYQIDEAIKKAHQVGRKGNLFKDNFEIIHTWMKGVQIDLDVLVDNEMLNQVVENINNSIEDGVVQPSYYTENEKLIITSGKAGLKVEENKLFEEINKIIKKGTDAEVIEIPFITAEPDNIDLEKIYKEVYKEVKDAYYTKEPFTIYPEVKGVDFDIENAKTLIKEPKESYEIPLIITKPSKTTKDIGTEASPDLLATFSTKYLASNVNRTTNLRLAANKINGTVLLPGEEFSYNKTVGERTKAAGFKEAAVFNAGRVENGLGGGICQISTTLYDAVVMADLDVTVRRNHQFVTSYVGGGKDATVVWGAQDFKFKNTRKYPIRITASVQGGIATVQIWGVREEVEYDITIETKKTATIQYTTQYIQTANLPAGQQNVVQEGNNGSKYEAYKVKRLNGQVISRTLLSKDTYNPMKKIVHVGIGQ